MSQHQKCYPALIFPSLSVIIPLFTNTFPKTLAPKVSNSATSNPPFCSLVSFSNILVTSFIKTLQSSKGLTIFNNSSFGITNVVAPDP